MSDLAAANGLAVPFTTGPVLPRLRAASILDRCAELQAASGQVRIFAAMLTQLTGQEFPQWIAGAKAAGLPGISSFAKGLEQDLGAVTSGLTLPWSSGPIEGRVNFKDDKAPDVRTRRTPLLRKRVLLTTVETFTKLGSCAKPCQSPNNDPLAADPATPTTSR